MERSLPDGRIVLNLGCGDKIIPGCINVDQPGGNWSGSKPDVECDIRKLDPFADDYADVVMVIHAIEHLNRWELPEVLAEWKRVLKPGGLLIVECPCLDKVLRLFDVPDIPYQYTMGALYGDPSHRDEAMMHRWCYSLREMRAQLEKAGFINVTKIRIPQYHYAWRDMRFEAQKPLDEGRIVLPE